MLEGVRGAGWIDSIFDELGQNEPGRWGGVTKMGGCGSNIICLFEGPHYNQINFVVRSLVEVWFLFYKKKKKKKK